MGELFRKIARRLRKPNLEIHIDRETEHTKMPANSFVRKQARATETAVYRANGIVSAMGTGHGTESTNMYRLEKIENKVFFNSPDAPPVLLSKGVHYIFGASGLIVWDGKTRLVMSQNVVRINKSKVAPVESVFFVDSNGGLHIKRFNRGWHDQTKRDILETVGKASYTSGSPLRQIAGKLAEFTEKSKVQIVENSGVVLNHDHIDAKTLILESPVIAKTKSGFVLKVGDTLEPLKEGATYVFGRFGLFELGSTVNARNRITERMSNLGTAEIFSRIESIFLVHNERVYLLTY
ncbi:MAG: hypothetical protein PHH82_01010 [Candidatus ainarchaeum sp.]|nr:hypothetical protein [Candidatus ainarchaeum sp.]